MASMKVSKTLDLGSIPSAPARWKLHHSGDFYCQYVSGNILDN